MLGEECPNVKFMEGPILEDVGLRGRGVIIVGSQAIIRRNVHNRGSHGGDSSRGE